MPDSAESASTTYAVRAQVIRRQRTQSRQKGRRETPAGTPARIHCGVCGARRDAKGRRGTPGHTALIYSYALLIRREAYFLLTPSEML